MADKRVEYTIGVKNEGLENLTRIIDELDKAGVETTEFKRQAELLRQQLADMARQQSLIDSFVKIKQETVSAGAAFEAAQAKAQQLGRELAATDAPTKKQTAEFGRARDAVNSTKDAYQATQLRLQAMRGTLTENNIETTGLAQKQALLRNGMREVEGQVAGATARLKEMGGTGPKAVNDTAAATDRAASSAKGYQGALKQVASAVAGVFAVGKVVDYARSVNDVADQYKNLEARVRLAVGAEGDLRAAVAGVGQVAKDTHSNIDATSVLYARLAASARELNITNAEALGITKTINQSIQVSGASAQASEAAVRQLVQGLQSGVLRGDEFNSVMENSPRLAKALADGLGVPIGALRGMAEAGELTSARVVKALKGQADAINKEFSTLPLTTGRALENLNTQWTLFIGNLTGGAQQSSVVAQGINALANNLETLAGVAARAGTVLTAALAVQGVQALRAFAVEMAATGKGADLLALSLSKVPKVISITVAAVGFEVGYQIGTMLYENSALARKLGVQMVEFFEKQVASLIFLKEAAAAIFTSDTIEAAFERYQVRAQQTAKILNDMWGDAEKAPTKVASAADAGADSLGKLGGAGGAAGQAVTAGALRAAGGVGEVGKAAQDAHGALAALAKTINTTVPAAALVDIIDNLRAAQARGVDLAKMLRDELPGALDKLSGAELTKFRLEFILAMNEAKVESKALEAGLLLIAEQAAKSLGVDTVASSNKVGAAFKDANDKLLLLIAALPDLEKAGVDTAAVVGQALSNMIDGAKNQAELDAVNERINRLRTQLGDKIADGLLDQAKEKALGLKDAMDKALPGINSAREAMSALGIDALQVSTKLTDGFKKADDAVGVLVKEFAALKAEGVDATAALSQGLQKLMSEAKNQADIDALTKRIESLRKLLGDKIADGLLDQAAVKAEELKNKLDQATGGINSVAEAMTKLGLKSIESMRRAATESVQAFDVIKQAGQQEGESYVAWQRRKEEAARVMLQRLIEASGGVADAATRARAAAEGLKLEVDHSGRTIVKSMRDAKKAVDDVGGSARNAAGDFRAMATAASDGAEAIKAMREQRDRNRVNPGDPNKSEIENLYDRHRMTPDQSDKDIEDIRKNVSGNVNVPQEYIDSQVAKMFGEDFVGNEKAQIAWSLKNRLEQYQKYGGPKSKEGSIEAASVRKALERAIAEVEKEREEKSIKAEKEKRAGDERDTTATGPTPARSSDKPSSSGGGGVSYVSNITIPSISARTPIRYADAQSQRNGEDLLRKLAQAKSSAIR